MAEDDKSVETAKPLTLGDLKTFIDDRITGLMKTGNPKPAADGDADGAKPSRTDSIAAEVAREIEKLKVKEKKDTADALLVQQIADLQAKTAEKAPVERSRRHRFMKWGD